MIERMPDYPPEYDAPDGPTDDEMIEELNAYGHMNWSVGDGEEPGYVACADFSVWIRPDDDEPVVAYEVVVDSGSSVGTTESGVFPVSELGDLDKNDWCPLHSAVDAALETGINLDLDAFQRVCKDWTNHLIPNVKRALAVLDSGKEIESDQPIP
jgi:hypothetical protein